MGRTGARGFGDVDDEGAPRSAGGDTPDAGRSGRRIGGRTGEAAERGADGAPTAVGEDESEENGGGAQGAATGK